MEGIKIPNVKKDTKSESIIKPYFKEPESIKKIEEDEVKREEANKVETSETDVQATATVEKTEVNEEPVTDKVETDKPVTNNTFTSTNYTLTPQKISSLLKGKTFKEAINIGKELGLMKDIAEVLDLFVSTAVRSDVNPDDFIRQVYSLYNIMLSIVNTRDTSLFSTKMRYLVNTICIAKKEGLVNELTFLKYDYKWMWGDKDYNRYSKLVTAIFIACDKGIKNVGKVVKLDRLGDIFNEPATSNLKIFF